MKKIIYLFFLENCEQMMPGPSMYFGQHRLNNCINIADIDCVDGGVQSNCHVKPNLGNIRLSYG